jgi:hypothetical protein
MMEFVFIIAKILGIINVPDSNRKTGATNEPKSSTGIASF